MSHKEYLNYLMDKKRIHSYMSSRLMMDESNQYYKLQQAHDRMYNDYLDRQIQSEELKAMGEIVQSYLKDTNIQVSLNGQAVTDAIVKEITKGLRR